MAILDNIATERQRVTERLARIDAERARLADQLSELEAAERVLSRFDGSKAAAPQRRRRTTRKDSTEAAAPSRGRRARAPAATTGPARARPQRRGRRAGAAKSKLPLGDATLRAVEALGNDVSAERVRAYLAEELGMRVRPNHLGMALRRHRRAGRLEQRDEGWSIPGHQTGESVTEK
jgi:hypothetical protein